ncbi:MULTISPECIES: hypothetical protein [unclassified Paenibacillus]|uniref:hypothetical protein n=1 Tax=unclassified Paenibacillus TaxID=185978 RepID=UPI002406F7DC|nr:MULTISPECIES: hypothetical protein [unclassified Paenibacillus]MDF9840577.1 hypothetical protein [Paenibacillus sp. PastF-2]MDF9847159.1 hypothetical protein [Paenibacillus sp. PastM-2]MDF9853731.1 hypothetical protein [Paenibacillus sp. PastF-1]MDH6478783.1 hypothetical protein [Paenibacillus sp. PastH-2]MDH6506515.1 hypothetical protein [Paenibacillus sp. PastM-3]
MNKITFGTAVLALTLLMGCSDSGSSNAVDNTAGSTNGTGTADAVTTASIVDNEAAFRHALSKEGTWIAAALRDLTFTDELVVDGQFVHNGGPARKIALYTQDKDQSITNSFTLTAPRLTVRSENTRLEGGIFIGDVYVEADGFTIISATVRGNIYFANKQYLSTFKLGDQGMVSGSTKVK